MPVVACYTFYRLGPLVTSWCMRLEAKNSYFKQIARRTNNFKNISFSVASRHQKLLCGYLQSRHFFAFDNVEIGPCEFVFTLMNLIDKLVQRLQILQRFKKPSSFIYV